MVNGSDSPSPAPPKPGTPEAPSLAPGPNGNSIAPSSESDGDRINLPASPETAPVYVRKKSEFLGLRRALDGMQLLLVLVLAFFCASFAIRNSDFFLHLAS